MPVRDLRYSFSGVLTHDSVAQDLEIMADSSTSYVDDVTVTDEELVHDMQDLNLGGHSRRYFGSSSGILFMGKDTPQDPGTPPIQTRTRPVVRMHAHRKAISDLL